MNKFSSSNSISINFTNFSNLLNKPLLQIKIAKNLFMMAERSRTPSKKLDNCVKCNQVLLYIKDALDCIVCHKRTHLTCMDGGMPEELAARIRRSQSQFHFTSLPVSIAPRLLAKRHRTFLISTRTRYTELHSRNIKWTRRFLGTSGKGRKKLYWVSRRRI